MKKHLQGFGLLLLELIFLLVGVPVFLVVAVLGVVYTTIKHLCLMDYSMKKQFLPILRSLILAVDGFANASAGEILNDTLKVPKISQIKYGKWYQTISAVTGILKVYGDKDTWLRKFLKILGKNHCEDAITEMEHYYYKQKEHR